MGSDCRLILFKAADVALISLDFLRKEFQQPVFQPVLLALMIGLHQTQARYIHIQIHLFLNGWIAGAQGFDFRVG